MGGERMADKPVAPEPTDLVQATEASIQEAYRQGRLTTLDQAAVQALRDLATKIAVQDDYFDALYEQAAERGSRPPVQDNVSLPTFLKYCDALGLTVAARARKEGAAPPPGKEAANGSKVARFRKATGAAG